MMLLISAVRFWRRLSLLHPFKEAFYDKRCRSALQFRRMTETPIPQLVLSLAAPTILSMLITSIYNLADTFFVGQISTSASGALGVVSS